MKETNKNKTTNFWIFGIIAIIFIFLTYQFDVESKTKIFCIPDDNFRNTIKINYPHCLNANNELIISEAEKVIEIYVDSRNIKNLEGLQFFKNLTKLRCNNNLLKSLPILPKSLKELTCHDNHLTVLPALPNSLTILLCYNNLLKSLPILPNSIKRLSYFNNLITDLPILPNSINNLDVHYNKLTNLPELPDSLIYLICYDNQLAVLPNLPNSLEFLKCSNNKLTILQRTLKTEAKDFENFEAKDFENSFL